MKSSLKTLINDFNQQSNLRSLSQFSVLVVGFFIASPSAAFGSRPPKPQPAPSPTPNPPPVQGGTSVEQIKNLASRSQCKSYSWKDRGQAPLAYVQGMALSFARSLCRERERSPAGVLMASKNSSDTNKDALAWFETQFDSKNMPIDQSGPDTLRSLYTLGVGLGMRESSGKYCEGNDVTAGAGSANTSEAGTFQFSYDSIGASSELRNLYNEYRAQPSKCLLSEFSRGVSCSQRPVVGSGPGADFQSFTKQCPAFAAEYAMLSLRVLRKHYGPINRREAEIQPSCNQMLDEVQSLVESRAQNFCADLR